MSPGQLNLHTMGVIDDVDVKYDYSYFTKFIKRNTHFAKEYRNIKYMDERSEAAQKVEMLDFGSICEFRIPMNTGDLLKSVCLEVKTTELEEFNHSYIDSFGNALIEYAELIIGGKVINRLTSDYLQLYSEAFHDSSKDSAFKNLINKSKGSVLGQPWRGVNYYQVKNVYKLHCIIDLPFYFHKHPELALPLCAIKLQDVTIRIKLRDYTELVFLATNTQSPSGTNVMSSLAAPVNEFIFGPPKIIKCELITELVYLNTIERKKIECSKIDYVITELQEEQFRTQDAQTNTVKCKLNFSNPVKELYFFIQRDRQEHQDLGVFTSPLNYDPIKFAFFDEDAGFGGLIAPDQLKYLTLKLDNFEIIDKNTGDAQFLRASQFMRYHSSVPRLSRVYMYSFANNPEVWYPTGQENFSLIKEQILEIELYNSKLLSSAYFNRNIRVYAKSYNILRVKDGKAHTIF